MKPYHFQIKIRDDPSEKVIGVLTLQAKTLDSAKDAAGFMLDLREVKYESLDETFEKQPNEG